MSPLHTPICDLLNIDHPIASAGMGGGHAPASLAAAVSEAGAFGGLGGVYREGPDRLRAEIRKTRDLTQRPFTVNLWCFLLDRFPQFLDVAIEEGATSVTLSFGAPGEHARRAKDAGLIVLHQVQTVAGATEAAAAGVDVIIAQGGEGGGHTGAVATMALVPQTVDVAGGIPVLAAGGIADGRGLVAALALGAQGVVMGTRFVAAKEAGYAGTPHIDRILGATADDTVYTDVFDILGGMQWPDGISGRSIRTPFADEWHGREDELQRQRETILAEAGGGDDLPVRLHDAYAGQSSGLIHEVKPAKQIVEDIVREAETVLASLRST